MASLCNFLEKDGENVYERLSKFTINLSSQLSHHHYKKFQCPKRFRTIQNLIDYARLQDHYRQGICNEPLITRDMSAMSRAIGQDLSNKRDCCYFAVCESCFLIAKILESHEDYDIAYCPRCLEKLSLTPLSPNEIFTMSD